MAARIISIAAIMAHHLRDLNAGKTVTLTLTFSAAVNVAGGTPRLLLNDGGVATYSGGTGTDKLTFTYTVGAGQNTPKLMTADPGLSLNGATIQDLAGNSAVLTGANSITLPEWSWGPHIAIDTAAPAIVAVDFSKQGTNLAVGTRVTVTLHLSESVILTGGHARPTITLSNGAVATYRHGFGTGTLVFQYTVQAGEQSTTGLTVTKINLTGNKSITDLAGNPLTLPDTVGGASCFMAGTLVRTPDGQRVVESLTIGDPVLTADSATQPVAWIGRQTVSRLFGDPLRVLPIRITAGALDKNLPVRDLLVSPAHALLVDGVLIQAGALVNGSTIRREENVPTVFTYYHVELADHALILAEGVPAETFVNNVDRMAFDNWDEHLALYPQGLAVAELPLPRAKSHRQVPMATRARLAGRAAELAGRTIVAA